jgi:hypothetical protein
MEAKSVTKIGFMFQDEYGNLTELKKEIPEPGYDMIHPLEFMLENFQEFLLALGYHPNTVDKIQIVEDDDYEYKIT